MEALRKAAEASAAKKKQLNLRTMLRKTGTREDGEEEQPGRGSGEGGEVQGAHRDPGYRAEGVDPEHCVVT